MSEIPTEACGHCGGTGGIDSGGVTPWGAPITLPCPACELTTLRARVRELEEQVQFWKNENDSRATLIHNYHEAIGYDNSDGFHCIPEPVEMIKSAVARIRELEEIDKNWNGINSMNVDIHEKLEARIKELEEAMPNPQKMRTTIHACFHGHTDAWDKLDEIADRIEKVMKR